MVETEEVAAEWAAEATALGARATLQGVVRVRTTPLPRILVDRVRMVP